MTKAPRLNSPIDRGSTSRPAATPAASPSAPDHPVSITTMPPKGVPPAVPRPQASAPSPDYGANPAAQTGTPNNVLTQSRTQRSRSTSDSPSSVRWVGPAVWSWSTSGGGGGVCGGVARAETVASTSCIGRLHHRGLCRMLGTRTGEGTRSHAPFHRGQLRAGLLRRARPRRQAPAHATISCVPRPRPWSR
jgi:hypothetical protein